MSTRMIAQDNEIKYESVTKNNENETNYLNRDYLRDITPKKINFVSVASQRNNFSKEDNISNQGTIGRIPVFKNNLLNDVTPKKGELEK